MSLIMIYRSFMNTFVLFVVSAAINSTDFSINDIKNALPEGVSLPPELEGLDIPNVEDAAKVFREKCIKVSGSDAAFEEAHVSWRKSFQQVFFLF